MIQRTTNIFAIKLIFFIFFHLMLSSVYGQSVHKNLSIMIDTSGVVFLNGKELSLKFGRDSLKNTVSIKPEYTYNHLKFLSRKGWWTASYKQLGFEVTSFPVPSKKTKSIFFVKSRIIYDEKNKILFKDEFKLGDLVIDSKTKIEEIFSYVKPYLDKDYHPDPNAVNLSRGVLYLRFNYTQASLFFGGKKGGLGLVLIQWIPKGVNSL